MKKPEVLRLEVFPKSEDEDSSAGGRYHTVINIFHGSSKSAGSGEEFDPITAHEYGHLIYDLNIREFVEKTDDFKELMAKKAELKAEVAQMIKNGVNDPDSFFAKLKLEGAIQELDAWDININRDGLMMGYQELFADIIAILPYGDPKAMVHAITEIHPVLAVKYKHYLDARDFSLEFDASTWNEAESHAYFAPFRAFTGKQIQKISADSNANKTKLVENILSAIARELAHFAKAPDEAQRISPSEANQRLLQAYLNISK